MATLLDLPVRTEGIVQNGKKRNVYVQLKAEILTGAGGNRVLFVVTATGSKRRETTVHWPEAVRWYNAKVRSFKSK